MKQIVLMVAAAVCVTAYAQSQKDLEKLAMKGDYQAQRNLAYSYVSPRTGDTSNKIGGCAWYLVILKSGSPKIDSGDIGNVHVYCDKLPPYERTASEGQSKELVRKIYKRD